MSYELLALKQVPKHNKITNEVLQRALWTETHNS